MIKISDFKKILRDNNIKFYSYWDKKKLVELVKEHGLFPEEPFKQCETPILVRSKDPKFDRLKTIMHNPRKVSLEDVETWEIKTFPSIHKAGKFIDHCPQTIVNWNGKVWKNKYRINIQ